MTALLNAAAQPGTEEELAGMSAFVQAFTAEVTAPTLTSRSHSMFAGRITRRATAMVAITLLAAGTAAAAAGGALTHIPSPFSGSHHAAEVLGIDTTTSDVSTSIDPSTTTDGTDHSAEGPDAADEAAFGLCQAWTNGGDKKADNPAFSALDDAATANTESVDEYCADVHTAHEAAHSGDDSASSSSTPEDHAGSSVTLPEQADPHATLPDEAGGSGKGGPTTTDHSNSGKGSQPQG